MSGELRLEDVRYWSTHRGIGCIVTSLLSGWVLTACKSMRSGDGTQVRPARICRKCRRALPNLRRA